jgi:hypothetical protein
MLGRSNESGNQTLFTQSEEIKMCQPTNDARTLSMIISDLAGCNIEGRVAYAVRLIEEGDAEGAKSELNELLEFIKEE